MRTESTAAQGSCWAVFFVLTLVFGVQLRLPRDCPLAVDVLVASHYPRLVRMSPERWAVRVINPIASPDRVFVRMWREPANEYRWRRGR